MNRLLILLAAFGPTTSWRNIVSILSLVRVSAFAAGMCMGGERTTIVAVVQHVLGAAQSMVQPAKVFQAFLLARGQGTPQSFEDSLFGIVQLLNSFDHLLLNTIIAFEVSIW